MSASGRQYVLVRTLGEGAFGSVYLADYESAGGFRKRVAVKLLHPTWDPESDAVLRLRDEARLLGRLQHPNIVRVDDLTQLNGRWAIVMEAIAGQDLDRVITGLAALGQRMPLRVAVTILLGVSAAIRAAWEMRDDAGEPLGVVHRDIKPSNILISTSGAVKVLDFGVARAAFTGRESKTGQLVYGSIGYMAPERLLGEVEEISSDVYAIAVVACEMFLRVPFGRSPLKPSAHSARIEAALASLSEELGPASAPIVELLGSMLRYDPTERVTIVEVHTRLVELARMAEGPSLESWAAASVPAAPEAAADPIAGSILAEGRIPSSLSSPTLVTDPGLASNPTGAPGTGTVPVPAALPSVPPSSSPSVAAVFASRTDGDAPRGVRARAKLAIGAAIAVAMAFLLGVGWALSGSGAGPAASDAAIPATQAATAAPGGPAQAEITVVRTSESTATAMIAPIATTPPPTAAVPAEPRARAPTPPSTTRPANPAEPVASTATTAAPPVEPPVAPEQPIARVRSLKVTLSGGSAFRVRCGDVTRDGTANILLRSIPAGDCVVESEGATAHVEVTQPRAVSCVLEGALLTCL